MNEEPRDTIEAFKRANKAWRAFWEAVAHEVIHNGGWRWFAAWGLLFLVLGIAWELLT